MGRKYAYCGGRRSSGLCPADEGDRPVARLGHQPEDMGTFTDEAVDYPDIAARVARKVSSGEADRGILICGTGVGMCIAANKFPGVRAAPCHDDLTAEMSRRHNDSNVLCLSADLLGERLIRRMIELWLNAPFEGGRHARRVEKIVAIEKRGRGGADTNARLAAHSVLVGGGATPLDFLSFILPPSSFPLPRRCTWGGYAVRSGPDPKKAPTAGFAHGCSLENSPAVITMKGVMEDRSPRRNWPRAFLQDFLSCIILAVQNRMKLTNCCATPSCATNWSATLTNRSAA